MFSAARLAISLKIASRATACAVRVSSNPARLPAWTALAFGDGLGQIKYRSSERCVCNKAHRARHLFRKLVKLPAHPTGAKRMSRLIKLSTPKGKPASLPKRAALTKAQAEHKAWLKARGIKVTKNTLRT
jgi:hypothetical protein